MPRTARASAGGYCYHVLNRGNARAKVFRKPQDYKAFVALIGEAGLRVPMRLIAYCLMPNHFHLALWPHEDDDLSRWMQWLMTTHVHRYLAHYHRTGHVWQGRFRAFPIEEDDHLRVVLRYIETRRPAPPCVDVAHPPASEGVRFGIAGSLPFGTLKGLDRGGPGGRPDDVRGGAIGQPFRGPTGR
jgi:REP element-mobilizing transposase RayT